MDFLPGLVIFTRDGLSRSMTDTKPRRIRGAWAEGYVLDVHSTGSTFLGYDEYGHTVFETLRTDVGELLYRLKYRGDATALREIGVVAEAFLRRWRVRFDAIVAVPPTRGRRIQPVFQIADELARRFAVPRLKTAIGKRDGSAEMKDIHEFEERLAALEGAFVVDTAQVAGKSLLLVDDLVRSGATMSSATEALQAAGAGSVYVFALTQTRKV
jgi:competence protein ComFC